MEFFKGEKHKRLDTIKEVDSPKKSRMTKFLSLSRTPRNKIIAETGSPEESIDPEPDLLQIDTEQKTIPEYFKTFENCVRYIEKNPSILAIPTKYSVDKLMMLLDNDRLALLERTFLANPDGLEMSQFIHLIIESIQHPKEERIDLVYGLVKLFKDIDINGDGTMEWSEFTQYLIEIMVGNENEGAGGVSLNKLGTEAHKYDYKTGISLTRKESDIVNKAYGRKIKMYMPSNVKDLNAHQSPIKKIVGIQKGSFMLVLEEYSRMVKVYDQRLKAVFKLPSSDMIQYQSKGKVKNFSLQKNEIPIIIDFIYSENSNLLVAATSNKKIIFWSLHTPQKSQNNSEYFKLGDLSNRFFSKIEYIYKSQSSISSLFYLKKYEILVLSSKEKFLTFHKIEKDSDHFDLIKIGFLEEGRDPNMETHSQVIMCVEEIWKSGYIVTGSLDGRIKAWDARTYCNLRAKNKELKQINFDYICDLTETDFNAPKKNLKKNKNKTSVANLKKSPQMNLILSDITGESAKGVRKFCYSEVLGGILLTVIFERDITVWSPDTSLSKAYVGKLRGHSSIVQDVKFIPQTLIAISVDEKFSFRIWDVRKLEIIQSIKEATELGLSLVNCLEYLPRGDKFVVGGRRLMIYDNKVLEKQIKNFNLSVFPLQCEFNPYYHSFVILTKTDLRVVDSMTGKLVQVYKNMFSPSENVFNGSNELSCFCFDERKRKIVIGDIGGGIRVYNLSNGELIEEIQKPGEIGNGNSNVYEYSDPDYLYNVSRIQKLRKKQEMKEMDEAQAKVETGLDPEIKKKILMKKNKDSISLLLLEDNKQRRKKLKNGITNILLLHHPPLLITTTIDSILRFYSYKASSTVTETLDDITLYQQQKKTPMTSPPLTRITSPAEKSQLSDSDPAKKKKKKPVHKQTTALRHYQNGHYTTSITAVHLDTSCNSIFTGAINGTTSHWNLRSSRLVYTYFFEFDKKIKNSHELKHPEFDLKVTSIMVLWPYKILAVGYSNGEICLWGIGLINKNESEYYEIDKIDKIRMENDAVYRSVVKSGGQGFSNINDEKGRELMMRIKMPNLLARNYTEFPVPTSFQLIDFTPQESTEFSMKNLYRESEYVQKIYKIFAGKDLTEKEIRKVMKGSQARKKILMEKIFEMECQISFPLKKKDDIGSGKIKQRKRFSISDQKLQGKRVNRYIEEAQTLGGVIMDYKDGLKIKANMLSEEKSLEFSSDFLIHQEPGSIGTEKEESEYSGERVNIPQKLLAVTDSFGQITTFHVNPIVTYAIMTTLNHTTPNSEMAIMKPFKVEDPTKLPYVHHPYLYLPVSKSPPKLPSPLPLSIIKSLAKRENINAGVLFKKYVDKQLNLKEERAVCTVLTDSFLINQDSWIAHNSDKIGNGIENSALVQSEKILKKEDLKNSASMSLVTWGEDKFVKVWRMKKFFVDDMTLENRWKNRHRSKNWILSAEISLVDFSFGLKKNIFEDQLADVFDLEKTNKDDEEEKRWDFKYDWLMDKLKELDEVFENLKMIELAGGKGIGELNKEVMVLRAEYLYRNYIKKDIIDIQENKKILDRRMKRKQEKLLDLETNDALQNYALETKRQQELDERERNKFLNQIQSGETNFQYSTEFFHSYIKLQGYNDIKISKLKSSLSKKIISKLNEQDKDFRKKKNTIKFEVLRIPDLDQRKPKMSSYSIKYPMRSQKTQNTNFSQNSQISKIKKSKSVMKKPRKKASLQIQKFSSLNRNFSKSPSKTEASHRIKRFGTNYSQNTVIQETSRGRKKKLRRKDSIPDQKAVKIKTRGEKLADKFKFSRYSNHTAYKVNLLSKKEKSMRKGVLEAMKKIKNDLSTAEGVNRSGHHSNFNVSNLGPFLSPRLKKFGIKEEIRNGKESEREGYFPSITSRSGNYNGVRRSMGSLSHRSIKKDYGMKLIEESIRKKKLVKAKKKIFF